MPDSIRVLIADDHAVVRQGVRRFLELQADIEVVGEAASGSEAVAMVAQARPDVVIMDLRMPGGDGIAAIRELSSAQAAARVLVLSSYAEDADVFAAIEAGAAGYMLKDVDPEVLVEAVHQVHRGETALHPAAAARLVHRTADQRPGTGLTPRELDVLRLLAEGFANKQIAGRLVVSEKTVKTHVSSILSKLGVQDRTQAALLAVRQNLLD